MRRALTLWSSCGRVGIKYCIKLIERTKQKHRIVTKRKTVSAPIESDSDDRLSTNRIKLFAHVRAKHEHTRTHEPEVRGRSVSVSVSASLCLSLSLPILYLSVSASLSLSPSLVLVLFSLSLPLSLSLARSRSLLSLSLSCSLCLTLPAECITCRKLSRSFQMLPIKTQRTPAESARMCAPQIIHTQTSRQL